MDEKTEQSVEKTVSYLLNLPVQIKEELEEIAKRNRRTLKGQILIFIEEGIKNEQPVPSL